MALRKLRIDSPDLGYLINAIEEAEKAILAVSELEGYLGSISDDLFGVEGSLAEIARHAIQTLRRQMLSEAEKQSETIEKAKESTSEIIKEAATRLAFKMPRR